MNSIHPSRLIQGIYMCFLIIINLAVFLFVHPLNQNLSDLGNALGHRYYLIIWGSSAAIYFYIYTMTFMKISRYTYKWTRYMLFTACVFMITSILIPYSPYVLPYLAKWHTRLAMLGTTLYIGIVFHVIIETFKTSYTIYKKYFTAFRFLVVFNLLLFLFIGGVCTLMETSFTIGMSILLFWFNSEKKA